MCKTSNLEIAKIQWEHRYSTTDESDKFDRWIRLGRIKNMTVAIIVKVKIKEKVNYVLKVPNNTILETLTNKLIFNTEADAKEEANNYIHDYISNFLIYKKGK